MAGWAAGQTPGSGPRVAAANATADAPRLPDLSRSPVDDFRELLAMSSAQQEEILRAKYAEEQRRQVRAKLREYQSMPQEEREARLKLVQLRWYLLPLMQLPPAERSERLSVIPADYRPLIEERLKQWDIVPPPLKKEILDHEWTVHYFVRMESKTPAEREEALGALSPEYRKAVEEKLANWRSLPPERRQRMYEQVHQFFELPPKEKEKTLEALTDAERHKMESALAHFERLSPEHRRICIDAFHKFASMSAEEQAQFLRNAERWKAMPAHEREAWRNLVTLLPAASAPMPPGYETPPVPMGANSQPAPKGESKPTPALPGQR